MTPDEARTELRALLPPGTTVSTIPRHVSRSGMTRSISPVIVHNGTIREISWLATQAVPGWKIDPRYGGIRLHGAGMDMGFWLVYQLSRTLYPDAFDCIGDRCPANDHSNGDRNYQPHRHTDGGYALQQSWL